MPKKTRISFTTNPIVPVVSAKDDEHCNEIHAIAGKLKRRYRFMVLSINEPIENFDQITYPSSFVLCPKFILFTMWQSCYRSKYTYKSKIWYNYL